MRNATIKSVLLRRQSLARSLRLALVVGTILIVVNHLEVIMNRDFTPLWWAKVGFTYLVPFLVCNYGMLTAVRTQTVLTSD